MALPAQCLRTLRMLGALLVILVTSVIRTIPADGATKGKYLVYIGTYTDHDSKGIYAYRFDSRTGQLTTLGLAAESANPSFLTVDPGGNYLYAVNELDSYQGQPVGAVSAFAIDSATGQLSLLNQVSSRDPGPAHITLDQTGKFAFVSNYNLGSVAVFPVLKDGRLGELSAFVRHRGSSLNQQRQQGPHAHAVALSPDNRFALVADLGIDQVLIYSFDAANGKLGPQPRVTQVRPGSGPRHLVFDPGGRFLYVINELSSSIVTYAYDAAAGELHEMGTVSTLPQGFTGTNDAAEIAVHPSGKFLYASNRGHDSIAVFSIDPAKGTPSLLEFVSTRGKRPRNFALDPTGSWLLAANQDSGNVVIFRVDSKAGRLTPTGQTLPVPSPACVKFVPLP
jgi:6-phosphogluconolactonase